MPSVMQVLKTAMPPGSEIIAGEAGLYNEVSWVIVVRPTPPGFDSLKGNELAIIGNNVAAGLGVNPAYLVSTLAERGASGIGMLGEISREVRRQAQADKIPLIQLPSQTSIGTLESAVTRMISEERQELYQRERELNHSLMELALAGGGSQAIIQRLRQLTGRNLGFIDLNHNPDFPIDPPVARALKKHLDQAIFQLQSESAVSATPIIGFSLEQQQAAFLGLIKVGREIKGYLIVMAEEDRLSEADRLAVRVGVMALAVEMSRRQAVKETEARYESDIIEELLNGGLSAGDIDEIGKRINLDTSLPYVCLYLRGEEISPDAAADLKTVSRLLTDSRCYYHDEDIVILHPLEKMKTVVELRKIGKDMMSKLAAGIKGPMTIGIGRSCTGLACVPGSFREAEQALTMGLRLFGSGSVTCFADLGIYRLLYALKSSGELDVFCQDYLGALMEYDRKHEGELVHTLKVFLFHSAMAEAARELHVHRNTLLYRLERIQEITGANLEDGEARLTMYVAVLASEVIRAG
ncbi:MAG: helix-turn-helix domain-containing protein [Dehalococcoidales bacterium]|nr:helix-turn-helix domain-containing protein [Dehalococcoidales bacterium]